MLSNERREVVVLKSVGRYGIVLRRETVRSAVAYCLLRMSFSLCKVRISFSCSLCWMMC